MLQLTLIFTTLYNTFQCCSTMQHYWLAILWTSLWASYTLDISWHLVRKETLDQAYFSSSQHTVSLCLLPLANLFFRFVFSGSPPFSLAVPELPCLHIVHSWAWNETCLSSSIHAKVWFWPRFKFCLPARSLFWATWFWGQFLTQGPDRLFCNSRRFFQGLCSEATSSWTG